MADGLESSEKPFRGSLPRVDKEALFSFLGWVLALIILDLVAFSDELLTLEPIKETWVKITGKCLFFLSVGFGVFIAEKLKKKALLFLSLFATISVIVAYFSPQTAQGVPAIFLSLVFLGFISGRFGVDFFLSFSNRMKFISLCVAFILSLSLFFFSSWPYFSFLVSFLLIVCAALRKNMKIIEKPQLNAPVVEWWLVVLACLSYAAEGFLSLGLLSFFTINDTMMSLTALAGGAVGVVFALIFLKSSFGDFTYALYASYSFLALASLGLFLSSSFTGAIYFASFFLALAHSAGLISLYYVLGIYTKKYMNLKFYYFGALGSSLSYLACFGLILLFPLSEKENLSIWAIVLFSFALVVFLFTPLFLKKKDWISDLKRGDVTYLSSLDLLLNDYNLTKREKEVASRLLAGMTLRQIAADLFISYPTVNTYLNSIYRKMGINSRIEFLLACKEYLKN
jgi:DNA-binding CsgD family transcriptional regulator